MSLDKAIDSAVKPAAQAIFRFMVPHDNEPMPESDRWLYESEARAAIQAALPHLEAHFRELHAKELEAEAIANRFPPDEDSFRSAATFLRRNTT